MTNADWKKTLAVFLAGFASVASATWKIDGTLSKEDYEMDKDHPGLPKVFSGLVAPGLLVQTRMAAYRTSSSVVVEEVPPGLKMPTGGKKSFARSFRIYSVGESVRVSSVLETTFTFGTDQSYVMKVEHMADRPNLVCTCTDKCLEVPLVSLPAEFLFTATARGEAELMVRGLGDSSLHSMRFPAPRFEWGKTRPIGVRTVFRSQEPGKAAEIILDELRTGTAVEESRTAFPVRLDPAKTFDPARAGWKMVFEDEFEGTALDEDKWTVRDGHPELVKVGNGELRIGCDFIPGATAQASSNLCTTTLRSRQAYRFGYFEARVKFTRQNGWWAAFWLYGIRNANPFTEGFEIDIFEDFYTRRRDPSGKLFNKIDHNLHLYCGSMKALKSWNYNSEVPGSLDEWYDVGCKWTPFEISYYINGRLVSSHAWHSSWDSVTFDAFSHGCGTVPLHLMLSGEIMKSAWNSDTQDITGCRFPDWYHVDRVRVWEYPETGARAPRVSWAAASTTNAEAEIGSELAFAADVSASEETRSPIGTVYLFDSGYPLQCRTEPPYDFKVPFDEAYYRTTRYMEPGRQNKAPSFDVPHAFQLFAQDADGRVGFSEPIVIRPTAKREVDPPLAFRARQCEVHRRDARDPALLPEADEFVFQDGCVVPSEDFADYLRTSMGVRARVSEKDRGVIDMRLSDKLRDREYTVAVEKDGVTIRARDKRSAAQALYHLEDLMNLRRAPYLKIGEERRRMRFSPRIVVGGYNGRKETFPDGYLAAMAHAGFDAIMTSVRPGECKTNLIDRALRWGIDTYFGGETIQARKHPDDPASDAELARTYGRVAKTHPRAKGFLFVPECNFFESRDPRVSSRDRKTDEKGRALPSPSRFPCKDYPQWLAKIERTIRAEIPDADIVFWTYNFYTAPEEDRFAFIDGVSATTKINVSFALGPGLEHQTRVGLCTSVDDYSIGTAGPSRLFCAEAAHVHARGNGLWTMCNTAGRTWDVGTCPYVPVPHQWKIRFDALVKAQEGWGLSGLIESWEYGYIPNFIAELAKESFTEGGLPFDEHLRKIAVRDFGERHADEVVAVWKSLSEAICDYVASSQNQYGPFRVGPAYPFNALGPFLAKGDPKGWPGFKSWICNPNYGWWIPWGGGAQTRQPLDAKRHRQEVELFRGAGAKFLSGATRLRAFADELAGDRRVRARRESGVAAYIGRSFLTAANVKDAAIEELVTVDPKSTAEKKDEAVRKIHALAGDEYANALAARDLLLEDSRLGWIDEGMNYIGGVDRIDWKLRHMEDLYGLDVTKPTDGDVRR